MPFTFVSLLLNKLCHYLYDNYTLMSICSEQLNFSAATLTILKTKCTQTTTIKQCLRGYMFLCCACKITTQCMSLFYTDIKNYIYSL